MMKRILIVILVMLSINAYAQYISSYTGAQIDAMLLKVYNVSDGVASPNKVLILGTDGKIAGIDTLSVGSVEVDSMIVDKATIERVVVQGIEVDSIVFAVSARPGDDNLTAMTTDGKIITTELVSWVAGTSDQITVTDDGDGTITLSLPQDFDTSADVEFGSITGLSRGIMCDGNIEAIGYIAIGDTTTGDNDGIIYFADDGNNMAESFKWDDGEDAFILSNGLGLGANNLGMTGTIGLTGSRVSKLWATAVEVTTGAGLTIGGAQISSDALSDVASIAMLDEAETVTGSWIFSDATTALTIGAAAAGVDYRIVFNGESNSGAIAYKEDEDGIQLGYNLFVAGDLGLTSDRVNKGWFKEIEVTNASGLTIAGHQISSDDLSDVASIAMLDEAETITGNWVNTTNPWADNEVAAFASGAKGDIHFASATDTWTELGVGTDGQVLIVSTDVPAWTTLSSDNLSDVASIAMLDEDEEITGEWTIKASTIEFDSSPAADSTANGIITTMTFGETVALYELLFMETDGELYLADADTLTTMPAIALALETGGDADTKKVLMTGFVRYDEWNWTIGGLLYASTTPGGITQTAPSGTNDVVQIVGIAISADEIYFKPEYANLEINTP
jgi:hypothetical protein